MNYIFIRVVRRVINDLQGQFTPTTNDIINNKSQLIGRCACTDSERLALVDPFFCVGLTFHPHFGRGSGLGPNVLLQLRATLNRKNPIINTASRLLSLSLPL